MKVKTSELSGAALDWAVAKATREEMPSVAQWILWDDYHPTTNWRHCGPLIEQCKLNISYTPSGRHPEQPWFCCDKTETFWSIGETALVAICRAVVASLLGDEIELPEGLANGLD
ncbi:DUF2591 domain-containing protein [Pectobacterium carotovorum]|uniref:DUF2591 domain-containing protein n=1 Tax=Pectobacterium carotovorum TaxID=554 RepID=UPI0021F3A029|nr:DUF2591 domain-containing protein [Pectobacterium carotovorum]